jgi:hypothetical protein
VPYEISQRIGKKLGIGDCLVNKLYKKLLIIFAILQLLSRNCRIFDTIANETEI